MEKDNFLFLFLGMFRLRVDPRIDPQCPSRGHILFLGRTLNPTFAFWKTQPRWGHKPVISVWIPIPVKWEWFCLRKGIWYEIYAKSITLTPKMEIKINRCLFPTVGCFSFSQMISLMDNRHGPKSHHRPSNSVKVLCAAHSSLCCMCGWVHCLWVCLCRHATWIPAFQSFRIGVNRSLKQTGALRREGRMKYK